MYVLLQGGNVLKKYISVFIITALLISMIAGFGGTALANGDITLSVEPQVTEMASGGSVTFDISVVNTSEAPLTGYQIKCNGNRVYSSDAQVLNDGAPFLDSFSMEVTDAMLGTQLNFQLCDSSGSGISTASDSVIVGKKAQTAAIACSAKADQTLIAVGDIVTFSFNIENKGNVAIDNIEVKADNLNKGKALNVQKFSLQPGKSFTVYYKHTFTAPITVKPYINYTVAGSTATQRYDIPNTVIELKEEERKVEATLSVDDATPEPGQEVTFTLKLSNSGNVTYTNLSVTFNGEDIGFSTKTLNPGDSPEKQYKRTFDTSTDVKFMITMKDQKNQTKTVSTNTIQILLPIDPSALQNGLKIVIEPDRNELTSEGVINFSGYIANDSEYTLSEVSITEASLGEIFSLSEMAGNTKQSISATADINATTTYNFTLSVKDRNGQVYTVNSEPITVTIQGSDAVPSDPSDNAPTVTLPPEGSAASDPIGVWMVIAIVLVVLIIGVAVAIIILWRKGRSPSRMSSGRSSSPRSRKPVRGGYGKAPIKSRSFRDRNNF